MKQLNITSAKDQISLEGALRSVDAIKLKSTLLQEIERSNKSYTVDITAVNNVDITGLNSLVMAKKYANRISKELTILANTDNPIFELVHLTKFGKFIDIQTV